MADAMTKDAVCKGCYYEERSYDVEPCKECSSAFSGMKKDWYMNILEVARITPSEDVKVPLDWGDGLKNPSKQLAEDHWGYIESLLKAHGYDGDLGVVSFHYKSAFIHGFKHGVEWMEGRE